MAFQWKFILPSGAAEAHLFCRSDTEAVLKGIPMEAEYPAAMVGM